MPDSSSGMKLLMFFAIAAIIVATINAAVTLLRYNELSRLTGYAGSSGFVNISLAQQITINVTNDTVDWGAGTFDPGVTTGATCWTARDGSRCVGGNWTRTAAVNLTAITVENIGNVNCSLYLKSDNNETGLFGLAYGTANQAFRYNWTQNELMSCNGGANLQGIWNPINITGNGDQLCTKFGYAAAGNTIRIDINLTIPKEGTTTGNRNALLTFTALAAS